jgi:hypothetical protein
MLYRPTMVYHTVHVVCSIFKYRRKVIFNIYLLQIKIPFDIIKLLETVIILLVVSFLSLFCILFPFH